jgi:hypothetical protein
MKWFMYCHFTILLTAEFVYSTNYQRRTLARKLGRAEFALEANETRIQDIQLAHQAELRGFRELLVAFIDKGLFFPEKIKELMSSRTRYVCVAKSSEGLSQVFQALQAAGSATMLPFTTVLHSLPGSVRPFERMDLYFIPVRSIPVRRGSSLRRWMEKDILPAVERERTRFLAGLPRKIANLAEPSAYKYIAFFIDSDSLIADRKRRKFSSDFLGAFITARSDSELKSVKAEFTKYIAAKDLALTMEWHLLVKTDAEKSQLLQKKRTRISEEFRRAGVLSLSDLVPEKAGQIAKALRKACGVALTEKKSTNLTDKIVSECIKIRETLNRAQISLT